MTMHAVGYQRSLPIDDDNDLCDIELPVPLPSHGDLLVQVLGWDGAAVMEAVGAGVRGFQPGDRI